MTVQGHLRKMKTTWTDESTPVVYHLRLKDQDDLLLNPFIGQKIHLTFTGQINCINCDRSINKTFAQGYCYPCFQKLAECDSCIVRPVDCHHHLGTCRDNSFAETHCFIPHIVYLAVSSGVKVGITRAHQKLTRWADQGASQAMVIAEVPHRKMSGEIEAELSQHISDKTNWRKMLSSQIPETDLKVCRDELITHLDEDFEDYLVNEEPVRLTYPVESFPEKISSYNLDKDPKIEDILMGIKGQYLVFEKKVINIRKYQGYGIEWAS